jgi:hypothetical protein
MAISLRAFSAIGPFCEDYFLYHEETDWMIRASMAGWTLLVSGASRVCHQDGGADTNYNALYYRVRNRFIALRRGISLSGQREGLLWLLRDQWGQVYQTDEAAAVAAKQGILDGVLRRTGPRPKPFASPAMTLGLTVIRVVIKLYDLVIPMLAI